MPFYRVMLHGTNFPGHPIGEPDRRFELFTTRWVMALNETRAEYKAVKAVWDDPKLAIPYSERPEERAVLRLVEIKRVRALPLMRGGGATWYPQEEQE